VLLIVMRGQQMIDTAQETPLSFSQAAKLEHLPIRRAGKRVRASTLWRWAVHGIRGIKLESIVCGGVRCTSAEAIQRFFEALTASSAPITPAARSAVQRQRAVEKAMAELERNGM
jgi:hypothetical protein